jgi:hypothetical protein
VSELWSPELFEPLTERAWDEAWVRERIAAIVDDAAHAYDPQRLWPADEWDNYKLEPPLKTLYVGAAGVIWALCRLARRGHAHVQVDLPQAAERTLELWQTSPDFWEDEEFEVPPEKQSALLTGETGVLLVAWRVAPDADRADRLHARIRESVGTDAVELMWGQPGVMLAARAMHEWTGEQRWLDAWNELATELRRRRDEDGLWLKRLYGQESRSLTPPHGMTGVVGALLAEPDEELERATNVVLRDNAQHDGGLVNWPVRHEGELTNEGVRRLQWCVGSPGIVISAAAYLDEDLLLAGAETTWRAGPASMDKGSSVCHGTAGNGYALLKTFERTQDEQWLERARRFAVHALEQVERRGHGRYSLFTGDVGVALFAADCLDEQPRYPVTDEL